MSTGQFCFTNGKIGSKLGALRFVKSRPKDGKVGAGVVARDEDKDVCFRVVRSPGMQL